MTIVRDCMFRNIATLSPNDTLMDATRRIARQSPGFAVVLDNMAVVGLITEFDLLKQMVRGVDMERTPLSGMTLSRPHMVHENTHCQELLQIYNQRRFRRFPVLNEEEMLSGGIMEKQILASLPRSNLLGHYRVSDVVVSAPPVVPPTMGWTQVAERLMEWHRGCVLVAKGDHLLGIISEADLLRWRVKPEWSADLTAEEIMSRDPMTIEPSRSLLYAMDHFREHGHRRLPVVESGRLVGLMTQTDLLKQMAISVHSHQAVLNPEDISEPAIWFNPSGEFAILALNEKGAAALELDTESWVGRPVAQLAEDKELWQAIAVLLRNCRSLGPLPLPLLSGNGNTLCVQSSFTLISTPSGEERVFWTLGTLEENRQGCGI